MKLWIVLVGGVVKRPCIIFNLKQVVNPTGAAAKLADLSLETGGVYKHLNNLRGFRRAFQ